VLDVSISDTIKTKFYICVRRVDIRYDQNKSFIYVLDVSISDTIKQKFYTCVRRVDIRYDQTKVLYMC